MPKHITFRERPQARGFNIRFRLDREHSRRWQLRHWRRKLSLTVETPWWYRIASR